MVVDTRQLVYRNADVETGTCPLCQGEELELVWEVSAWDLHRGVGEIGPAFCDECAKTITWALTAKPGPGWPEDDSEE